MGGILGYARRRAARGRGTADLATAEWLLLGRGVMVLLAFLFTRGKPQHAQKGDEPFIGVVVSDQPAPPTMPAFESRLSPGAMPRPVRPAMLSYVVPHSDGAKPEAAAAGPREGGDPPQTSLAFKAASLPGSRRRRRSTTPLS